MPAGELELVRAAGRAEPSGGGQHGRGGHGEHPEGCADLRLALRHPGFAHAPRRVHHVHLQVLAAPTLRAHYSEHRYSRGEPTRYFAHLYNIQYWVRHRFFFRPQSGWPRPELPVRLPVRGHGLQAASRGRGHASAHVFAATGLPTRPRDADREELAVHAGLAESGPLPRQHPWHFLAPGAHHSPAPSLDPGLEALDGRQLEGRKTYHRFQRCHSNVGYGGLAGAVHHAEQAVRVQPVFGRRGAAPLDQRPL